MRFKFAFLADQKYPKALLPIINDYADKVNMICKDNNTNFYFKKFCYNKSTKSIDTESYFDQPIPMEQKIKIYDYINEMKIKLQQYCILCGELSEPEFCETCINEFNIEKIL